MNVIKMPVVTEEDVLRGDLTFPVSRRDGKEVEVTVKAVDWRTAIAAGTASANGDMESCTLRVLGQCLPKEQRRDEFLNQIVPAHLFWISTVAMQLTNGVDEAKKMLALKNAQASGNSSVPSAT